MLTFVFAHLYEISLDNNIKAYLVLSQHNLGISPDIKSALIREKPNALVLETFDDPPPTKMPAIALTPAEGQELIKRYNVLKAINFRKMENLKRDNPLKKSFANNEFKRNFRNLSKGEIPNPFIVKALAEAVINAPEGKMDQDMYDILVAGLGIPVYALEKNRFNQSAYNQFITSEAALQKIKAWLNTPYKVWESKLTEDMKKAKKSSEIYKSGNSNALKKSAEKSEREPMPDSERFLRPMSLRNKEFVRRILGFLKNDKNNKFYTLKSGLKPLPANSRPLFVFGAQHAFIPNGGVFEALKNSGVKIKKILSKPL